MRARKPHKGLARLSGDAIGKIAVKVYECNGCGLQAKGERPTQCGHCGRLDFTKIDSIAEANRVAELRLRQQAGLIKDLQFQVRYNLMAWRPGVGAVKVGEYIADAVYTVCETGAVVREDVKGGITDLASWKLRHMAAQGMPVSIVTMKG